MNRHLLAGAAVLACLFIINIAYACVEIDVRIWDYQKYVCVTEDIENPVMVSVTAEVDYGGPATDWQWIWTRGLECDEDIEENEYDSTAEFWSDTQGVYRVWAKAWNAMPSDDYDWADVYVIDVEIEDNPPDRDTPEYIAYGTGMNVYYKIEPTSGWTPSDVRLYIKDSTSTIIRWVTLSNGLGEQTGYWDGKYAAGPWVEPGEYTAEIRVSKYGTYIYSDPHTFYVLDVQITEPDGDPEYDHQFSFNSAGTGVCVIPETGYLTGTTGITALNADLKWTLSDHPSEPTGPEVTFTYTGLPSSNSGFGTKTLTLTHQPSGLQDTMDLEIFFEQDAKNHPGAGAGTTTNYFYYWGQQYGAVPEIYAVGFQYRDWDWPWNDISGRYYYGTLYLCKWANYPYTITDPWTNLYYKTSVNTGPDGVCNTPKREDDIQVIDVDEGTVPYAICITAGPDGWMHSNIGYGDRDHPTFYGDDELDLTGEDVIDDVEFSIDATSLEKCAITCTHEMKHKEIYEVWTRTPDSDFDGVSYNNEINFRIDGNRDPKLDPSRYKTYASFYNDPEFGYEIDEGLLNDQEFITYMSQHSNSADPDQECPFGKAA